MITQRVSTSPVASQPGRIVIPVPWREASLCRARLRKHDIRSTLILDPQERTASLELWPGVDAAGVRAILDGPSG
jgi:hypothetical protein